MDYLFDLFNILTIDKAIEAFSRISLYSFPLLLFLNGRIQNRRLELTLKNYVFIGEELRTMYVRKTLQWVLMLTLYIASVMLAGTSSLANLTYPVSFVYLGFSWGLISIELKSILLSYKEVKSEIYVPTFKRASFWILASSSAFKLWQLSIGSQFGAPSQVIAMIDLASYAFIFISLFVFVFFDKKRNLIEKALNKSRKIVISIKDNVIKDDRHRKKRDREIVKLLRLLRLCLQSVRDDRKKQDIMKNIRELELLLATSFN